ncbi:hypothetical protein JL720_14144 [Aureococcus anophagefferens]|nr:hypothetical protein JL720_14144 [Aureococcus anophagefferens]
MLSIPVKKSQSSEGFGPALLTYIQRNYGEGEAARFRNLASSLDGARSASAEAAAELCRLESESSGESSAVAVARVARRRVPDADSAMESFMCEWDDGWARSRAAADAPEKEEKKDGARSFLQKAKGHLKELKKGSLKKSGSKSSLPPLERQRGSLRLERGATLYNLACCESFAGAAVDRSGERGVKQACRHFLKAAGLFEYLRRSSRAAGRRAAAAAWGCLVLDGDDVVVDLSVGALDFCEHLMLAQAQACFYEKAIAARHAAEAEGRANGAALGPGVVARLAAHAAHCYWKARASCAEPDVEDEDPKALEELLGTNAREQACFAEGAHESLLPSFLGSAPAAKSKLRDVDDSWANHAEFQARCFEAAASFWSAKAKEEEAAASGEGYGLLVAYLDLADRHCVGALRVAARPRCRASGDALKTVQGLRELAKSLRDAVAADNAQIYRETVPPWSDRDADALQRCADADEFVRAALRSLDVPQCLDDFDDAVSFATPRRAARGLRRQCQASRSRAATFFHAGDGDRDLSACLDALRDGAPSAAAARPNGEPADEAAWRDDGDALDLAVPDESEDRRPEDDDVPPPPPPAVAAVAAAQRGAALVDDLARPRTDTAPATRPRGEDALRRVHAGAATFERLAASLAERTSTYADICREANRRDAEAVDTPPARAAASRAAGLAAPAAPPVYGDAPAAPPVYADAPAPYAAAALPAYGAAPLCRQAGRAGGARLAAPAAPAYGAPAAPAYAAPAAPAYGAPAAPAYGAPAAPAYGAAPAAPAFAGGADVRLAVAASGAPAPAAPSRQQQELDDEALARRLAASFEQEDAAAARRRRRASASAPQARNRTQQADFGTTTMKLHAALCLATATFAAAQIQLLDGPDAYSGTIHAFNPATNLWGNVCDDEWDLADADVVCRQVFGTNYEAYTATSHNYFGSADNNNNFVYDDVDCGGSENNLVDAVDHADARADARALGVADARADDLADARAVARAHGLADIRANRFADAGSSASPARAVAAPTAAPTASFIEIISIGTASTCVANHECELVWVYRGDPGACETVIIETVDLTDGVLAEETTTNDGNHTTSFFGDAGANEFTVRLTCDPDASLTDSKQFAVSFTPAPTSAPSVAPTPAPSVAPTPSPSTSPTPAPSTQAPTNSYAAGPYSYSYDSYSYATYAPSLTLVPSTLAPTMAPTLAPTAPTLAPTETPTLSLAPTLAPTSPPTVSLTPTLSLAPTTASPTLSLAPTLSPTPHPPRSDDRRADDVHERRPRRRSSSSSAPKTVGTCDELVVGASSTQGSGGRPWQSVTWNATAAGASPEQARIVADARRGERGHLVVATRPRRRPAQISATFVSALGAAGSASHAASVAAGALPSVKIVGGEAQTVQRSRGSASAQASAATACGDLDTSALTYAWELTATDPADATLGIDESQDPRYFEALPFELGGAACAAASSSPAAPGSPTPRRWPSPSRRRPRRARRGRLVPHRVGDGPARARGVRVVRPGVVPAASDLAFLWTCAGDGCGSLESWDEGASTLALVASPGSYAFDVEVSAGDGRSARASQAVDVVAAPVPSLEIAPVETGKVNPSASLVLEATVGPNDAACVVSWSLAEGATAGGSALQELALADTSKSIAAAASAGSPWCSRRPR